ncbi:hypothetical protein AAFF_G00059970 [Aldrovandia affinis]|uniref:Cell death regulator Aven n=1 Tax=Aldrovandia affinis TaxID=143900 RepID=A0AAD7WF03_9TELE|nr:hypothetical protein AAFF_G00059970 [Aldrovandia affinis]
MEPRPRGRGGSWKRGGGSESHQSSGEHRGRGRGSQNRGRGRRDHYRGRGRGGYVAEHRQGRDEADGRDQEDEERETFSRRKLESNWDRYEAEEKEKKQDEGPTQRGAEYHTLLGSAGDSFTQFRLAEERDWEVDSLAIDKMLVDLNALTKTFQALPLYLRLNLEAELAQEKTPVELPTVTRKPKRDSNPIGQFRPPPAEQGLSGGLGISCPVKPVLGTASETTVDSEIPAVSCGTAKPPDGELDQDLDLLLNLQTAVPDPAQPVQTPEEDVGLPDASMPPEEEPEAIAPEAEPEPEPEVEVEAEAVRPEAAGPKVMEDDLEDWLDSMIS